MVGKEVLTEYHPRTCQATKVWHATQQELGEVREEYLPSLDLVGRTLFQKGHQPSSTGPPHSSPNPPIPPNLPSNSFAANPETVLAYPSISFGYSVCTL